MWSPPEAGRVCFKNAGISGYKEMKMECSCLNDNMKCTLIDKTISMTRYLRSVAIIALSAYFFLIPSIRTMSYLRDPGLADGSMCSFLYDWHQSLSKKYEVWAQQRLASNKAAKLSTEDISGTEWPLFGSVFYLWATESLQVAWEEDSSLFTTAPTDYAKEAIEAATALVVDPAHASWVKEHWGESYLEKENLFYRMLLIHSMLSYQTLLHDRRYESLLVQQVDSLAQELDRSPYGLLDDYPGQCYPVDIMPAYAAIRRADILLGSDHSEVLERGIRAFQDNRLDSSTGLPAYNVDSETGYCLGPARGVGMSFMLIWAPELWPDTAGEWYGKYGEHFWLSNCLVSGFREFKKSNNTSKDWIIEVDAGPVLAGYGMGASAFGIGAARANGRMNHAYPLTALALAGAWRLPDGTLPVPRLLSNAIDAPYLGEAAVLFCLTRRPVLPIVQEAQGHIPLLVWLIFGGALIVALLLILSSVIEIKRVWTGVDPYVIPLRGSQLIFRVLLFILTIFVFIKLGSLIGQLTLIVAVVFPYIQKKRRIHKEPIQEGA